MMNAWSRKGLPMRSEILSDYPETMLANAERNRRRGAVDQLALVESLREERRQARSSRRCLACLRLSRAVSQANREATRQHLVSALPTAREQAMQAGRNAEHRI